MYHKQIHLHLKDQSHHRINVRRAHQAALLEASGVIVRSLAECVTL